MSDGKFPEGCCPQCGLPYGKHHPMCGYGRVERPAIADTHPKDGGVKQAPLVSGGRAGTAIAQKEPPPSLSDRIEQLNQGGSK